MKKNFLKMKKIIFIIFIIAASVTVTFFSYNYFAKSSTSGWSQATWSGGADTSAIASYTSNQDNWTKYFSKDANVVTSNNQLTTNPANSTVTDSKASDFSAGSIVKGNGNLPIAYADNLMKLCVTTTANAGADQNLPCSTTSATLAGNAPASGQTGLWSVVSGMATITSPSSPTSGITGLVVGTSVTLRWTISNAPCNTSTDDVIITIISPPVCGETVTFNYNGSSVTYGTVLSACKCWLDRNLGATRVAISSTDAAAYGDLFQWGRLADGHQIRTSVTTATKSSTDVPGHNKFIFGGGGINDWRSPQNASLWQGVSGVNNPCPTGYRMPTSTEYNNERLSWSSNNSIGAFSSPLKLTVAGQRIGNTGLLQYVGVWGNYWSSTVGGANGTYLEFGNSVAVAGSSSGRSFGIAVRCVKN